MPNNQAQDRYNPTGIGSEFEEHNFSDINIGEIFRLNADSKDESLYRKENETQAIDVKTRLMHNIGQNIQVYITI